MVVANTPNKAPMSDAFLMLCLICSHLNMNVACIFSGLIVRDAIIHCDSAGQNTLRVL